MQLSSGGGWSQIRAEICPIEIMKKHNMIFHQRLVHYSQNQTIFDLKKPKTIPYSYSSLTYIHCPYVFVRLRQIWLLEFVHTWFKKRSFPYGKAHFDRTFPSGEREKDVRHNNDCREQSVFKFNEKCRRKIRVKRSMPAFFNWKFSFTKYNENENEINMPHCHRSQYKWN